MWMKKEYDKMDKLTFLFHIKSLNIKSWEEIRFLSHISVSNISQYYIRCTDSYLLMVGGESEMNENLVYDPSVDLWSPLTISNNLDMKKLSATRAAVCKSSVYFLGKRFITYTYLLKYLRVCIY